MSHPIILALGIILVSKGALANPITALNVSRPSTTVTAGDTFSLCLSIAKVIRLFDYQLDITFDPTVLCRLTVWQMASFL